MKKQEIYLNVLDRKQFKILPRLGVLRKDYGFYLGGGTALALQIGHRSSVDFDFYTLMDFDPKNPRRGLWFAQVLNFWDLMLKINLPDSIKNQAIFQLALRG